MSENLTDTALRVMDLANNEAHRFQHEFLDPDHILLALVKFGIQFDACAGAKVLRALDVDLHKMQLEIERSIKPGRLDVVAGKLPYSVQTREMRAYAAQEAQNLGHNYIGTEHLLLGLLRQPAANPVGQIFGHFGLSLALKEARAEVRKITGGALPQVESLDISHLCRIANAPFRDLGPTPKISLLVSLCLHASVSADDKKIVRAERLLELLRLALTEPELRGLESP